MLAEIKSYSDMDGRGVIQLIVPAKNTVKVMEAINGVLKLAGHEVRHVNNDNEELISAEEVFSEGSPAMALRGFRGKMEWTQQELAERLGVNQNVISEMESGKRSISTKMAKKLGETFELPYKVFL